MGHSRRDALALLAAAALLAGACQQILGLVEGKPRPASSGEGATTSPAGGAGAGGTGTSTTTGTVGGSGGVGGSGAAGAGGAEPELPIGTVVGWPRDLAPNTSLPSGWWPCDGSVVSAAASPLDGITLPDLNGENRFLRGGSTSGAIGGLATHTHTITVSADAPGGSGTKLLGSATTDAASNLPPYYDSVALVRVVADADTPVGAIVGWASSIGGAPKTLPPGWVGLDGQVLSDGASPYDGLKLPDLNAQLSVEGRFLRFADQSGGLGGAPSHSHTIDTVADGAFNGNHETTNTGETSTDDSLPPYYAVRWIARVNGTGPAMPPIGTIVAWLPTLAGVPSPLADGFLACDGQQVDDPASPLDGETLPDLASSHPYLRGGPTSGATGGSATHSHTQPTNKPGFVFGNGAYAFENPYSSEANEPPFYEVVFIVRVK